MISITVPRHWRRVQLFDPCAQSQASFETKVPPEPLYRLESSSLLANKAYDDSGAHKLDRVQAAVFVANLTATVQPLDRRRAVRQCHYINGKKYGKYIVPHRRFRGEPDAIKPLLGRAVVACEATMRKHNKILRNAEEQLAFGHRLTDVVRARDHLRAVIPACDLLELLDAKVQETRAKV